MRERKCNITTPERKVECTIHSNVFSASIQGCKLTGYAVLEKAEAGPKVCEAGVIRSSDGPHTADMALRIRGLYDGLCEILDQWKPGAMAIEQLYAHYDHPAHCYSHGTRARRFLPGRRTRETSLS